MRSILLLVLLASCDAGSLSLTSDAGPHGDATLARLEQDCLDEYAACVDDGVDPAKCEQALGACRTDARSLDSDCAADRATCIDAGKAEADCDAVYDQCVSQDWSHGANGGEATDDCRPDASGVCTGDGNGQPGGDGAWPGGDGTCERQLDQCLSSGVAPERCKLAYEACVGNGVDADNDGQPDGSTYPDGTTDPGRDPDGDGQPGGDDPNGQPGDDDCVPRDDGTCTDPATGQDGSVPADEACRLLYGECLDLGLPPDWCADDYDTCLAANSPPPCDALRDECLQLGLDADYCEAQHDSCVAATSQP